MTAQVILVVAASWCLVSIGIGLTVCRTISWARGMDTVDEATDAAATAQAQRPAVELPGPRSSELPAPALTS